jgi:hypothetical protein
VGMVHCSQIVDEPSGKYWNLFARNRNYRVR